MWGDREREKEKQKVRSHSVSFILYTDTNNIGKIICIYICTANVKISTSIIIISYTGTVSRDSEHFLLLKTSIQGSG